jgi:hypothetical protein
MRMRNVVGWMGKLLIGGALMIVLFGCGKLLKKKDAGAGSSSSSSGSLNAQDEADEQLQEKLDEYIKCLNSLASAIHQSRHRYLTYIPKTGPTGRETFADLYRLPVGATATCSAGISRAKVMPPSDPKLESAGSEFSSAATDIDRLINEMDRYYENKDFRDDRWAKGKIMHPRLMASFDRFSRADKTLHDTLDGITKPLAQRVLGRIDREEGKKFRYFRKKTLITARELVEASDPIGDDDDIDFALYSAAYTEFEKALDELTGYGALHKTDLRDQKTAPSWPMADSNYDNFVKEAGDFKKMSKEFWRCLRDAPPKAKTPSGKIDLDKMGNCADGPAWKQGDLVIKEYNEFIRTSNNQPFP